MESNDKISFGFDYLNNKFLLTHVYLDLQKLYCAGTIIMISQDSKISIKIAFLGRKYKEFHMLLYIISNLIQLSSKTFFSNQFVV